ncbi:hypothetical protein SAMN04489723_11177 [Algoriphagus aquimarinus]|uniref:Uncharacterized protein n=1 Tax=Algoriphagus aquimarinus TaxID=237018 RepID=A0A1I1BBW9_9BACT|nr:hypothetical protein SAMN04489723_11177 [Algoriphagus aquimarinus]
MLFLLLNTSKEPSSMKFYTPTLNVLGALLQFTDKE